MAVPDQEMKSISIRAAEWLLERASRLPRPTAWALSSVLGRIWHRVDSRHRRIALKNLEFAWGDELNEDERQVLCRKVFDHFARVVLEVPYLLTLKEENLEDFITFSGLENVEAALQKQKGLLVMASHFGNWEMMSLASSLKYAPLNVVIRPLDYPFFDQLIDGIRCRSGNRTIPKKGSVRQVLRLLRQGEIVALLVDQNVDWYDGVFVPFFKQISCTNKALAVLALRTGAPVIPIFNVRMSDGRYHTFFDSEVPLIRTGDTTSDIEQNTALFNRIIERYVRLHPEQWFWLHQKWKTRPYQLWPRRPRREQEWLVINS